MFEQVVIKYPNGCIKINLEKFFPSTPGKIKKIIKIVDMDWEHSEDIRRTISKWMRAEIGLCEEMAKGYAKKYLDMRPKVREAEAKLRKKEEYLKSIASWKDTAEYKEAKQELKEIKHEFGGFKILERSYNSSFKQYQSRKEKLQKNLEVVS